MKTDVKQFIKNCSNFTTTEEEGLDCFRQNINYFDNNYIGSVLHDYSINYFQKKELIKFDESSQSKLLDFIISTIESETSIIQRKKNKSTMALSINPTNLDKCYGTLLWFFSKEKDFPKLCDAMLQSIITWIDTNKPMISKNNSETIQDLYSIILNFSKIFNDPAFIKTKTLSNCFEDTINSIFEEFPAQTLVCSPLKCGVFNNGHKAILKDIDKINLSRKRVISLKQIEFFNTAILKDNPVLNELFEFEIREKTDLLFIDENEKEFLNLVIATSIGKLKARLEKKSASYVDFSLVLKALSKESRFEVLNRFDLLKCVSISELSNECIRLSDDFGNLSNDDIDFIEISYSC